MPFRVLAATKRDVYRKPRTGMYDYVVDLYKEQGIEIGELGKSGNVADGRL